ncbi:30S ribosomal protein S2 [Candidatus Saccharibacteria bacterium]|nr:30S ribosomal protein S2 [Candidatus Saccharibacteria bacterium]
MVKKTVSATDTQKIVQELLKAGAHFGHRTERWHPKMAPFIHSARNGVHIIDLIQTGDKLVTAEAKIRDIATAGGSVLFVATKRQAKAIVQQAAIAAGMPYVTHRWLGGMLTNWNTISGRIRHLKKLEAAREDGSWDHLTKKERLLLEEEIASLTKVFSGVKELSGPPAAIFIVDLTREDIAIKEANTLGIPVFAMVDTNADPTSVEYPIPANDDAVRSIQYITERIAKAAADGKAVYDAKTSSDSKEA